METEKDKKLIRISAIIATVILVAGIVLVIYYGVRSGEDKITTTTAQSTEISQTQDKAGTNDEDAAAEAVSPAIGSVPEKEPDTTVEKAFKKLIEEEIPRANTTLFRILGEYRDFHFYSVQVEFEGEIENHVLCVYVYDDGAAVFYEEKFERADSEQAEFVADSISEIKQNYSKYEKQAQEKVQQEENILY